MLDAWLGYATVMDGLEIIAEDDRWNSVDLETLARRAVVETLRYQSLDPSAHELAILACTDEKIAQLNGDFRAKPAPTNVLSWPVREIVPGDTPDPELGDIAIAYETCAREAIEQGKLFDAHVLHLLVHATLHLLGYDHQKDAEATQMEQREVEILGKMGVPDPY